MKMETRNRKLKPLSKATADGDASLKCCKGQCLATSIPRKITIGVRNDFTKLETQVQQKAAIVGTREVSSKTSFALAYGTFPICWKGLCYITGVSSTLLQSVVGSPGAR